MQNNLTLVIPAKYEAESLPEVIMEIKKILSSIKIKIILEENDIETIAAVQKFNCEIIYQKKRGYGNALSEGINLVDTKYFCIFNADGSFDPKELIGFYNKIQENDYDFIFGSRYLKNNQSEDDTLITLIGNKVFSFIGKFFFRLPITDILYTYVIGKVDSFKKINFENNDFRFCVELPIKAMKINMKFTDYPCYERKRIAGEKKVNALKDGYLILQEMIKLFFK